MPPPSRAPSALAGAMHFIDIAANLTDAVYAGLYNGTHRHPPDISTVLTRARDAGVVRSIVTAGTLSQSHDALALARAHGAALFSTVGVHPTRANELQPDPLAHVAALERVVRDGRDTVVAVGECGLDYDRTHFCDKSAQMAGFVAHFALAERTRLPMFLHDRNTGGDFARVVAEHRREFTTGVVHSFTGTMDEMRRYVDMDLYIGLNGCSLKTRENLDVACAVPLHRVMLETDCPYCEVRSTHAGAHLVRTKWPAKDKKKYADDAMVKGRNEPCQIRHVCEVVAQARGIEEEELARAAFNNTMRIFFPNEARDMGPSPFDWSIAAVSGVGGS